MVAERSHLSIGEVLTLLQPEYPDITISKIRFLESQGLLDPERTPSGYRKFHDDDIDRLRWILTQQRDHFLPLKVIKERLATGDLEGEATEGVLPLGGDPVGAPSTSATPPVMSAVAPPSGDPDPGSNGETTADAAGATPRTPLTLLKRAGVIADDDVEDPTGVGSRGDAEIETSDERERVGSAPDHERARAVAQLVEGPVVPEPPPTPPRTGRDRHPTGHTAGDDVADAATSGEAATTTREPLTLSLDDLSEATGLTARELGELERYGLLVARSIGAVDYYDEDALIVARLAVGFQRYGIEPRHLRMYKVAAEREAGLFEQLITPLLKQRRPGAREEAVEMLEDLAELADDLRAAMVRSALRAYLGQA